MGDVGSGMEYQQTVGIAADDGEDGCGDAVEVVVFTRGAANAVVLDIEEKSGVVGQTFTFAVEISVNICVGDC